MQDYNNVGASPSLETPYKLFPMVNVPSQGTQDTQRIGDKWNIKTLKWFFNVSCYGCDKTKSWA